VNVAQVVKGPIAENGHAFVNGLNSPKEKQTNKQTAFKGKVAKTT
jgi:hypothetical protein